MGATIEWISEQVCGDCGEGVFTDHAGLVLCTNCEHEHHMDRSKLAPNEVYQFKHTTQAVGVPTLHVISYLPF